MENFEKISPETVSLDLSETNANTALDTKNLLVENIDMGDEFITEGSEKCEAFCDIHPVAMQSFFEKFMKQEHV